LETSCDVEVRMSADPRPGSRKKAKSIAATLFMASGAFLIGIAWSALKVFGIEETSQSGELAWMGFVSGGCLILTGLFQAVFFTIQANRHRLSQDQGEQG